MSISEAIYQFLTQHTAVGTLVSTRVYPSLIDTRVAFPAIGYEVASDDAPMHMRGESGLAKATVILTCWAESFLVAGQVAEAVRNAMSGLRGSLGGVYCRSCFVGDFADVQYSDASTPGLYRAGKQTELTIWHSQSVPTPIGV